MPDIEDVEDQATADADVARTVTPRPVQLTDERLARVLIEAQSSTARQSHGFVFQSGVSRLLGLYVPYNYTDEVDAYSIKQPLDIVMRHSFKNMKTGSAVELGSLSRNAACPRDFVLYVAFWTGFATNVREVHVLHIRSTYWQNLFPSNIEQFDTKAAFRDHLGEISNSPTDDPRWALRLQELKEAWRQSVPRDSPIAVAYKRDHKKQRRVQCSIPAKKFAQLAAACFDPLRTHQLECALDSKTVPEV